MRKVCAEMRLTMIGKLKHYFACGNTARGFQNFFESNLADLKKVYILKGGPGTGKSTLMKRIGTQYLKEGYDIEYIHCSSDPDSLDGMIVRSLSFGIVDGTAPHVIEPTVPGAVEEYVNLGVAWDTQLLKRATRNIKDIKEQITECYNNAYERFHKALEIHDEWEKIYIQNMDFGKAEEMGDYLLEQIFSSVESKEKGKIYHRFLGGSTPYGAMDYVENLTEGLNTRYFIKGRPGSGKSTMLKKLLKKAEELGLTTEVYHCGFDPDSLDMLIFPELSLCIFDSTAPHEYFPADDHDIIIDMYEDCIKPETDENNAEALEDIKKRYKAMIDEGIYYLAKAKALHDELEQYYVRATDYEVVDAIVGDLIENIEDHIEEENNK